VQDEASMLTPISAALTMSVRNLLFMITFPDNAPEWKMSLYRT